MRAPRAEMPVALPVTGGRRSRRGGTEPRRDLDAADAGNERTCSPGAGLGCRGCGPARRTRDAPRSSGMSGRATVRTSLAGGVVMVVLVGSAFTKTGPFAYDGLLGYYLPGIVWGGWIDWLTVAMLRDLRNDSGTD